MSEWGDAADLDNGLTENIQHSGFTGLRQRNDQRDVPHVEGRADPAGTMPNGRWRGKRRNSARADNMGGVALLDDPRSPMSDAAAPARTPGRQRETTSQKAAAKRY